MEEKKERAGRTLDGILEENSIRSYSFTQTYKLHLYQLPIETKKDTLS